MGLWGRASFIFLSVFAAFALSSCKIGVDHNLIDSVLLNATSSRSSSGSTEAKCSTPTTSPFGGGAGTASNPYLICDRLQFLAIGSDADYVSSYFKQGADIDMGGVGSEFTPLFLYHGKKFAGEYNGNGKTLSNLVVDNAALSFGLFNDTTSAFQFYNLKIDGFKVRTGSNAALITPINNGTIRDVEITNSFLACYNGGGVVNANNGSIQRVSVDMNLACAGFVGGFTQSNSSGAKIVDSAARGIFSNGGYSGGLVSSSSSGEFHRNFVAWDTSITPDPNFSGGWNQVIGGLAGQSIGDTYTNNQVLGTLTLNADNIVFVGGFAGDVSGISASHNYVAYSSVMDQGAGNSVDATIGSDSGGTTYLDNAYYDHANVTFGGAVTGNALNLAQMQLSASFGFDFTTLWQAPSVLAAIPFPILQSFLSNQFFKTVTFDVAPHKTLKIVESFDPVAGTTFPDTSTEMASVATASLAVTNTTGNPIQLTKVVLGMTQFISINGTSTCVNGLVMVVGATCQIGLDFKPYGLPGISYGTVLTDMLMVTYLEGGVSRSIGHQVDSFYNQVDGQLDSYRQLAFPMTTVGYSSNAKITFTNVGNTVDITAISSNSTAFVVGPGVTNTTCATGAFGGSWTCDVGINFSPTAVGYSEGVITVAYTDSAFNLKTQKVQVSGFGSQSYSAKLAASSNYTFSGKKKDGTLTKTITLTNSGTGGAVLSSFISDSLYFTYNSSTSTCQAGASVAASATCTLAFDFTPNAYTAFSGNIVVSYLDPSGNSKALPLTATGTGIKFFSGSGVFGDPYIISAIDEFVEIPINNAGQYLQTQDLDFSALACDSVPAIINFQGTYDGGNKKIIGFCQNTVVAAAPYWEEGGLFRSAIGANFKNMILENFSITTTKFGGALTSRNTGVGTSTINNVHVVNATITAVGAVASVGGLATYVGTGFGQVVNITNCSTSGTITENAPGVVASAGGLLGYTTMGSTISNSSSSININLPTGTGLGGLVAINYVDILESYATGNITGNHSVGGFVGQSNGGTIRRSFASGTVTFTGNGGGGFAGVNAVGTNIFESVAYGSVVPAGGSIGVGGFVGINTGSIAAAHATGGVSIAGANGFCSVNTGTIAFAYFYDNGVNTDATATPLNAAALTNSASFVGYAGWFPSIWRMPSASSYSPILSPIPQYMCGTTGVTCF